MINICLLTYYLFIVALFLFWLFSVRFNVIVDISLLFWLFVVGVVVVALRHVSSKFMTSIIMYECASVHFFFIQLNFGRNTFRLFFGMANSKMYSFLSFSIFFFLSVPFQSIRFFFFTFHFTFVVSLIHLIINHYKCTRITYIIFGIKYWTRSTSVWLVFVPKFDSL